MPGRTSRLILPGGLLLLLMAGCATHSLPAPTAETSPITGTYARGVIEAVRPVNLNPGDPTVSAVLTALGQTAPASAIAGQEIVIRRDDGSITSVGLSPDQSFASGQTVDIVTAAETVIRPD